MNIHPLFVHFPIAFLLLYAIIKILPLPRWLPNVAWRQIERALLVVGVIGAFIASSTGETAEHLVHPPRQVVEMHSLFADSATWIFAALLLGEIAAWIDTTLCQTGKITSAAIRKVVHIIQGVLCNRIIAFVLALCGLIAITLTGLLGGVMVYGTTADPLAGIVLRLLGISL